MPDEQENPYAPKGPPPLICEVFEGINTTTTRPGVPDKQLYWSDGWMPLSERNLRVLPGIGPKLWTAPAGGNISFFDFANIGPTPIMIGFHSDGGVWQVNTESGIATRIAPDGTILNPSRLTIGVSQWGGLYVLIICDQPNGYFVWDGGLLYQAGTLAPQVDIINNGSGYIYPPTVTISGGSGSGATFISQIANGLVTEVIMTNPGVGYVAGDEPLLSFSGGSYQTGSLIELDIINGGFDYTAPTITITGGGGSSAAATAGVGDGIIENITITNAGSGYSSTPTIAVVDPTGLGAVLQPIISTVAAATVSLMPYAVSGNVIETFQGRVWTGNGPQLSFTAPGSATNFATSAGGGSTQSSDSFLRVGYTSFVQTNGFLYLLADSSINYVSGVTTTVPPGEILPVTTFTNQNADPETGTIWPGTVDVWSRNIVFANAFGVHVSYGASVTKISEALDGVYNTAPNNFAGLVPSAAKAIVYGKKVWILLLPIIDPVTNQLISKLFMWNGKIWWSSQQDIPLTFIQAQEINSVLTAYGTDGTSVYPLFQQPSTGFTKTVQSRLWDTPGGYQFTKSTTRLWALFQITGSVQQSVTISIDNEINTQPYVLTSPKNSINVVNASGTVIPCKNASLATIPVFSIQSGNWVSGPQAVGQQGVLTGLTIETGDANITLVSAMFDDNIVGYRG